MESINSKRTYLNPKRPSRNGRKKFLDATPTTTTRLSYLNNLVCLTLFIAIIILIPAEPFGTRMIGFTTPSAASYLDDSGQISSVLNEFVDALLEKVAFLAEIIIDSSMSEQCEFTCLSFNDSKELVVSLNNNKTLIELRSTMGANDDVYFDKKINHNTLSKFKNEDKYDADEFTNVGLFIDSLKQTKKHKRLSNEENNNCRLFNLIELSRQDLPIGEMESCCKHYNNCYANCNKEKLDCDLEFQLCFRMLCKERFDYKNNSLVYQYHQQFTKLDQTQKLNEPLSNNDGDDLDLLVDELADKENLASKQQQQQQQHNEQEQWSQPNAEQVKRFKDKYKACKLASKVLIIGNLAFGCMSYKEARRDLCCNKTIEA